MENWSLHPIFNSYALVVGLTAGLWLLLLVPIYRAIRPGQRLALVLLRSAVIFLLLLLMLRPTHVSNTQKKQSSLLLILFDTSRSMTLPHAAESKSRWDAQRETLEKCQETLAKLPESLELKLYRYDRQLQPVAFERGRIAFPAQPDGPLTDIGTALFEAFQRDLGKRLAAVVLLGDGAQTAFDPRVEIHDTPRELGRLGTPLYTVSFGPAAAAVQSRDVAVENLPEQFRTFVKNTLPVRAIVRVRGYVNQELPVELSVAGPGGKQQVVGTRTIVAREDDQPVPVEIPFTPQQIGQYVLTLRVPEQSGELVTKNNELTAYLTVDEGGLKLLYVEGELRQEQIFLRRSLAASPDMDLEFQWIDPRRRSQWPIDLSETFSNPAFDAFLLGDLDSTALSPDSLKALAAAVEKGKGLLLLGGFHSFGAGGYQNTPLADVMPITTTKFERQDFDRPIREDLHLGPVQMLPTGPHPITRLASGSRSNDEIWRELAELKGANRFADVKKSTGVRVIAATPDDKPLLVTGEYGRGRVLAFAGDSTWQWWRQGHQAEHKRFWRQAILWLVGRDDNVQDTVWVKLPQRRFNPGTVITFTAGSRTGRGEPILDGVYKAEVILPNGQRQTLRVTRDGDHMAGTIDSATSRLPGEYRIEVSATNGEGKSLGHADAKFQVLDRDIELSNPAADPDQLARLSALTKDAGGRLVAAEQLPALLDDLRRRPPETEIEVETKWQLADGAVDSWLLLIALVGFLGTEWALRKRWGLV